MAFRVGTRLKVGGTCQCANHALVVATSLSVN